MNASSSSSLWTNPKKLVLLVLACGGVLWLGWDNSDTKSTANLTEGPAVTVRDLAGLLKQGNSQRLRELALSDPPTSLYDVGDFLVGIASPQAMNALREICTSPDGALVISELAEDLPIAQALPLCRDLSRNSDERVRNGAVSTLFWLVARPNKFSGPWPIGMQQPSAEALAGDQQRWDQEKTNGNRESFEEWRYKEAVTAFLCGDRPASAPQPAGQSALLAQLNAELGKRFGFKLQE